MKKLFKSFYISFALYLLIILFFLLIQVAFKGYKDVDLLKSYLPTLFIFYIPMYFSFLYFKKEKYKFKIFKSSVISFVITYVSAYLFYKYIDPNNYKTFFSTNWLFLAILSLFTNLFISVILILIDKNKNIIVSKFELYHSNKILLVIPFIGVIIYTIIIFISLPSFFNSFIVWSRFLPFGIILSFISFYFFKYIYTNFSTTKRIILIISYYIIITLFFIFVSNISIFVSVYRFMSSEKNYQNTLHSIVLFGPFFMYVITLVHLYYLKLVSKQEKEQLTQESLESQLNYQQLKNQLSPHFLFNNINVLTSLIEENPKKAVAYSENLSHIYRYFLEQEKQDVVLVKDEINFAKSYLELLKDRFEIGLNFTINIDEIGGEKYIVSTILQQVLENVVKHNTINETNIVNVKITSEENYLIIENNKNQKLKTVSESKKGIENIKKRIAFFTDKKVIIEDSETRFIIKLPILETV